MCITYSPLLYPYFILFIVAIHTLFNSLVGNGGKRILSRYGDYLCHLHWCILNSFFFFFLIAIWYSVFCDYVQLLAGPYIYYLINAIDEDDTLYIIMYSISIAIFILVCIMGLVGAILRRKLLVRQVS